MALADDRRKIQAQLKALERFENTRTVRQLRQELKERLKAIDARLAHAAARQRFKRQRERRAESRLERSRKAKKYHHYIRLIRNNYPEHSYLEIRRMFAARKKGQEVSVPDPVWQNPSP